MLRRPRWREGPAATVAVHVLVWVAVVGASRLKRCLGLLWAVGWVGCMRQAQFCWWGCLGTTGARGQRMEEGGSKAPAFRSCGRLLDVFGGSGGGR